MNHSLVFPQFDLLLGGQLLTFTHLFLSPTMLNKVNLELNGVHIMYVTYSIIYFEICVQNSGGWK